MTINKTTKILKSGEFLFAYRMIVVKYHLMRIRYNCSGDLILVTFSNLTGSNLPNQM